MRKQIISTNKNGGLKLAKNGSKWVMYKGNSLPLIYLARIHKIPTNILRERLRAGWSVNRAINTPVNNNNNVDNEKSIWEDNNEL